MRKIVRNGKKCSYFCMIIRILGLPLVLLRTLGLFLAGFHTGVRLSVVAGAVAAGRKLCNWFVSCGSFVGFCLDLQTCR